MKHLLNCSRLFAMLALLIANAANAQTLYTYELDEDGLPGSVVTGITASDLTRQNGLITEAAACGDGFNSKGYSTSTGAYSTTYTADQVIITPAPGYEVTITSLAFELRRNNNGNKRARFAYSTNGGATWIDQGFDITVPFVNCNAATSFSWDFPDIVTTSAVIFRIYGWDASNVNGVGSVRNSAIYGTVCLQSTFYADADGDGYGNPAVTTLACTAPSGYVADNTDCDDTNSAINPGATEVCNGIDDNCNGSIDEGLTFTTYYADADGDGYGDAATSVSSCSPVAGYVTDNTDCNDAENTVYPGAIEICDGLDNDCNGDIDENLVVATIAPADSAITCKGFPVTFSTEPCAGCTYQWFKNDNPIIGAIDFSYSTTKPAYYSVQVSTPGGCFDVSDHSLLISGFNPNANIYYPNGLNLCAPAPGHNILIKVGYLATNTYQWYKDGLPYTGDGATSWRIYPTETGNYTCSITSIDGCNRVTDIATVINSCRLAATEIGELNVYPNPAADNFTVTLNNTAFNGNVEIQVVNMVGQIIVAENITVEAGELNYTVQSNNLTAGMYLVKVISEQSELSTTIVINK